MFHQPKIQEVIVIAIDLNRADPGFEDFDRLSPGEKLEAMTAKIRFICQKMQSEHPSARWIIAWREYGITGSGEHIRTVPNDFKKQFKKTLLGIVSEYPNLTIIAGTIATEKKGSIDKIKKIQASYRGLDDLSEIEIMSTGSQEEGKQIGLHEKSLSDYIAVAAKDDDVEYSIIRNTSYIFTLRKCTENEDVALIIKHNKSAPLDELKQSVSTGHKIFYPGGDDSRASIFNLDEDTFIATEICREHDLGVSKIEREKKGLQDSNVLLHFVLSDSVKLQPRNFLGQYVIQLDSVNKPRLLIGDQVNAPSVMVSLYQVNGLERKDKLVGPLVPVALFAERILAEIDGMIRSTRNTNKIKLLDHIRVKFIESSDSFVSAPMYKCLESYFYKKEIQATLFAQEKAPSFFSSISRMFGSASAQVDHGMRGRVQRVLAMVDEEKQKNPDYQEYAARYDSPVMKKDK